MHIAISGLGAMGRALLDAAQAQGHTIAYAIHPQPLDETFPVYPGFTDDLPPADVLIDFSHFSQIPAVIAYATAHRLPLVIGTTGLGDEEHRLIDEAAKTIPVMQAGNMSLGIALLTEMTQRLSALLPDFDIEIVETHHRQKVDAPSGTAEMLVTAAKAARPDAVETYGRHGKNTRRHREDITVHSLRGGTIVGEHQVLFAGEDETLRLTHQAGSKRIFATGALQAAHFLLTAPAGRYTIHDILGGAQ